MQGYDWRVLTPDNNSDVDNNEAIQLIDEVLAAFESATRYVYDRFGSCSIASSREERRNSSIDK